MLHLLDILFTLVHLVIISINLFGWIWYKTRRLHLWVVIATALSWLGLGIWYGWGYCPVTDWQWRIKEKLGEHNLPNSFIKYYADKLTGHHFDPHIVDVVTGSTFALVALLSVYVNFLRPK